MNDAMNYQAQKTKLAAESAVRDYFDDLDWQAKIRRSPIHKKLTYEDICKQFTNADIRDLQDTVVTPTYFGDSKRCVALSTVCYMEMVSYQLARKDYLDALVGYIESLINHVS